MEILNFEPKFKNFKWLRLILELYQHQSQGYEKMRGCDFCMLATSLSQAVCWEESRLLALFVIDCSVASCVWLCDPGDCSTPGFPVLHSLPEFAQTHVHWVHDAIQPSHPQSSPSPPAFNLSQHQGLSQWVSSLHQVAKVLELQLQNQFFQWILRVGIIQKYVFSVHRKMSVKDV